MGIRLIGHIPRVPGEVARTLASAIGLGLAGPVTTAIAAAAIAAAAVVAAKPPRPRRGSIVENR